VGVRAPTGIIVLLLVSTLSIAPARAEEASKPTVVQRVLSLVPTVRRPPQYTLYAFDIDGNFIFLPTKNYLTKPNPVAGEDPEIAMSAVEWRAVEPQLEYSADRKEAVVKSGKYQGYKVYFDPNHARYAFRAKGDHAYRDDIIEAVTGADESWQGRSWNDLVEALSHPWSARSTLVITARSQSPQQIYEGFQELQKRGYIKYLPLMENIYPVNYPALTLDGKPLQSEQVPQKKVEVLRHVLDKLQARPFRRGAVKLLAPEGGGHERLLHTVGFSDDTPHNADEMQRALSEDLAHGKYSNLKITVKDTRDPLRPARATILTPTGGRERLPVERDEVKRIRASWDPRVDGRGVRRPAPVSHH
jgi:hypothetical protein